MKRLSLLATVTMITIKMFFTHFYSNCSQGNIFLHQNHVGSPNYNWENRFKQIRLLKKVCHKVVSCVNCQEERPYHQGQNASNIVFIFTIICLICRCHLFNMSCLSYMSLMASLDILCFNLFNLKNKIMKIEHKKIFRGPSKILKNVSWPINICLKYFMTPTKTIRSPSYMLNVRSLKSCCLRWCVSLIDISLKKLVIKLL